MDITINPVSGTSQQYTPPVPKVHTDSVPAATPQDTVTVPANVTPQDTAPTATVVNTPSTPSIQGQYENAARQAALSFKNVYALGDTDFSMFKDVTGKYITRYVSLRDGKVTYVPEPTFVKPSQSDTSTPTHVAISV